MFIGLINNFLDKALLHRLSRAAISRVQGGRYSGGFWSGFASSLLSPLASSAGTFEGKIAMNAIVGGTASELGGKFANGAVSGAFVHMFNGENIIASTAQAVKHYFSGKGGFAALGDATKYELRNSYKLKNQLEALKTGTAKVLNGNLSINLTSSTFHVGRTGVVFNTMCSGDTCTTGFVAFVQASENVVTGLDSFSDPLDIGMEILGGTPYSYLPYSWTETYKNNF